MQAKDKTLFLALFYGFIVFSFPLLLHDTRHLWWPSAGANAAEGADDAPSYPPYVPPEPEDERVTAFRAAVTDGKLDEAKRLHAEAAAATPPLDLVTKEHWHGNTPLYEAARAGQKEAAEWLLANGADADHTNEWGDSPLNEAGSMGHWDVVWLLADKGANLTRTSEHGHSSLILSAVRHHSPEALAELMRRGADINQRQWNQNTVLHEAARSGQGEVVQWLLEHGGVDVNAVNDAQEGAVSEAASMGHTDILWQLVKAGAELGAPASAQAASLLHAAVRHANLDLLTMLHEKGVPVDVAQHGRRPLAEAVARGELVVVEWLLQHGANASDGGEYGEPPICAAADDNKWPIVWRLHEAGADVHVLNQHGGSLLMSAVHAGAEDEVTRLLSLGLGANSANRRGDTPLTLAASRGDVGMMKLLIRQGASAVPRGARRDTALLRAARFRKVDAVRFLLTEARPPLAVDEENQKGDRALLEACRAGSLGVAELLLSHGADVQKANKRGMTPLLEAAEASSLLLVKALLGHQADVHATNKQGDGPLDLAQWGRQAEEIQAVLKEAGAVRNHGEQDDAQGGGEPLPEE